VGKIGIKGKGLSNIVKNRPNEAGKAKPRRLFVDVFKTLLAAVQNGCLKTTACEEEGVAALRAGSLGSSPKKSDSSEKVFSHCAFWALWIFFMAPFSATLRFLT